MDILKTTTQTGIDISDDTQIFEYLVPETMIVIVQITLQNIVGNYDYHIHLYSDDILTVPDHSVPVLSGINQAIFQSRSVLIVANSTITIAIKGDSSDVNINVITKLINATPLTISDLEDAIIPIIEQTITNQFSNIEVRPTKTILGACANPMKSTLQPIPRSLKTPRLAQ